jgi:hypothetical protein
MSDHDGHKLWVLPHLWIIPLKVTSSPVSESVKLADNLTPSTLTNNEGSLLPRMGRLQARMSDRLY